MRTFIILALLVAVTLARNRPHSNDPIPNGLASARVDDAAWCCSSGYGPRGCCEKLGSGEWKRWDVDGDDWMTGRWVDCPCDDNGDGK